MSIAVCACAAFTTCEGLHGSLRLPCESPAAWYETSCDRIDHMTANPQTDSGTETRPVAAKWVVIVAVISSMALGVFAARAVRLRGIVVAEGHLEAERIRLSTNFDGEVVRSRIALGDDVKPGDVVAIIRTTSTKSRVELERELAALEKQQAASIAAGSLELAGLTRELDSEIHEIEMQIASLKGDKYAADMERIAWRDALESNDITAAGYDASLLDGQRVVPVMAEQRSRTIDLNERDRFHALLAHERAASTAAACEQQVSLCESRLKQLRDERTVLSKGHKEAAGYDRLADQIVQLRETIDGLGKERELVSPAYGKVVSMANPGDSSRGETPVVELADEGRRRVSTSLPSHIAAKVSTKEPVEVVFSTGERAAGRIQLISPSSDDGETVTVIVEPTGRRWPQLAIGCRADVAFQL